MTVEDLLDWVERRFISGTLIVERSTSGARGADRAARTFVFNSGRLVGAESSNPAEQLGQMLRYRGLIDDTALREAFKVQRETGVLLGRILVMVGAIEEVVLQGVLEDQAIEALHDALTWTAGTFTLERRPAKSAGLELSVDLRAVIEEARRRAVDWVAIRSLIPSDDAVLVLVDRGALVRPEDGDELRALSHRLADALERGLSVSEIVVQLAGGRYELLSHLALLIGRGAVAVPELVSADLLAEVPPEPAPAAGHAASGGARAPGRAPSPARPAPASRAGGAPGVEPEFEPDIEPDIEIEIEPPGSSGPAPAPVPRGRTGPRSGPAVIPGRSAPGLAGLPGRPLPGLSGPAVIPGLPGRPAPGLPGRPAPGLAGRAAVDLAAQARAALAEGRRADALPLARDALALDPNNRELQRFAADTERAVFAELSRELLTTFRIPQVAAQPAELAALELSETERYLIGRIDGRWDLLSLIRMGPLSAAEALLTFKQLADRGIITL